jgi:putative multicomponent Na+:H+ antiporter subunit B
MIDKYIYIIIALLPLTSLMLVSQVNPYHALVMRAIVGAIAALIYVILGAADVALTEALVGTMLAVTLYLIAVRSSLVMRLGVLSEIEAGKNIQDIYFDKLIINLQKVITKYHLRLEIVEYPNSPALEQALMAQEVHAICSKSASSDREAYLKDNRAAYQTTIRVHRLFEIMQQELTAPETTLTYLPTANQEHQQS